VSAEIAKTKTQAPNKLQNPKFKRSVFAKFWDFSLWDFLGIWNLGFGISAQREISAQRSSHKRDSGIPLPKLFVVESIFVSARNRLV
jgi:hypothetical protein